jgi:hypothetical protein
MSRAVRSAIVDSVSHVDVVRCGPCFIHAYPA